AVLIVEDETVRGFTSEEDPQTVALLHNPSVSEKLLEALYSHTGTFATLEEERWCRLVAISSKNERLRTEIDYHDSPDMEHYSIHKAIFRLLEIAPLKPVWIRVLYDLLTNLD